MTRTPAWLFPVLALLALGAGCDDGDPGRGAALAAEGSHERILTTVEPFELTERSGRTITLEDLSDRVWVASFVFTTCTGPCPSLSRNMKRVQDQLEDTNVQLVSFSVDPRIDTLEALNEYADSLGADPERWWFLRGAEEDIYRLARKSFLAAVERAPDDEAVLGQQVTHSTRFSIVDRRGRLRNGFDGQSADGIRATVELARRLDAER